MLNYQRVHSLGDGYVAFFVLLYYIYIYVVSQKSPHAKVIGLSHW